MKNAASKVYKKWKIGDFDRYEVSTNDQDYSPDQLKKVAEDRLGVSESYTSIGSTITFPTILPVYETKGESVVVNFEWEEAKDALDKASETLKDQEDEVLEQ